MSKPNPFQIDDAAKPASKTAAKKPVAVKADPEVVEARKRLAAKRAAEKKAAAAAEAEAEEAEEIEDEGQAAVLVDTEETEDAEPEEVAEEVEDEADDSGDDADDSAEETKESPVKASKPRRTATVVQQEADAKIAALQAEMDAMRRQMESQSEALEIGVVKDKVLLEDGVGGDLRIAGGGKSLLNNDWRATADGIRLIVGRSSAQSTQSFQIPVSLVKSLSELLAHVDAIIDEGLLEG